MRRVLIGIGLTLVAAYSALYLYGFLQLRSARRLTKSVEELQIGVPISQQQLRTEFPNLHCTPDRRCYTRLSNVPFPDMWLSRRAPLPRVMPAHSWYVIAQLGLDPNGSVIDKELGIDDGQYYQFGTVGISVRKDARLFDPCADPSAATYPGYRPRREHRTSALLIDISPDADQSLLRRVFDLHLDCLNSIGGCRTPGDIAPVAWQDTSYDKPVDYRQALVDCGSKSLPPPLTK
jgi:hypothetical protein